MNGTMKQLSDPALTVQYVWFKLVFIVPVFNIHFNCNEGTLLIIIFRLGFVFFQGLAQTGIYCTNFQHTL